MSKVNWHTLKDKQRISIQIVDKMGVNINTHFRLLFGKQGLKVCVLVLCYYVRPYHIKSQLDALGFVAAKWQNAKRLERVTQVLRKCIIGSANLVVSSWRRPDMRWRQIMKTRGQQMEQFTDTGTCCGVGADEGAETDWRGSEGVLFEAEATPLHDLLSNRAESTSSWTT